MKKLFTIITLMIFSLSAHAIFLSQCHNYSSTEVVSYSYVSCVNMNFDTIERAVDGLFLFPCYNYNDEVSYSYTSCINDNFSKIGYQMESSPFFQHCFNSQTDELSYSFVSCVNNNFRQVEYEID
ncbi:MAG: hypothetical protein ISR65_11690 [Bacteriovoracaceae bacterium]|nr:hypothetical protein [Bacteriovoracaceae bacterium]